MGITVKLKVIREKMIINKSQYKWIISFIILVILAFLVGTLAGVLNYPPSNLVETTYKSIISNYDEYYDHPDYSNTNVSTLIFINNKYDVIKKRNELIRYIWKNDGFPVTKLPNYIEKDIKDDRYSDLGNLKGIDKIIVTMDHGLTSIIYHFYPSKQNNKLVIYHAGHNEGFISGKNIINALLDRGYSVMTFSMPLMGMNNQPTINFPRFGKVKMINHMSFIFLDSDILSSIKFFVEPLAVSLNYLDRNFNYSSISMVGFSGGGWTTIIYSAIDTRISRSYPVSGSFPIYMNTIPPYANPHYEKSLPQLYRVANYLELYILGSEGDNRKQLQIINKYNDKAAFGYLTYEKEIKKVIANLGKGKFDIHIDDTHKEHKLSDSALNIILNDLES